MQEVYESVGAYPHPPLCSVPDSQDLREFAIHDGLMQHWSTRWISRAALRISGFHQFASELREDLEPALRKHNLRIADLAAHGLSATMLLSDDHHVTCPYQRAASLLIAARQLRDEIVSGALSPDRVRGESAEMGQYPNLFGTNVVIDEKGPRVSKTNDVSQVLVIVEGQFFLLEIGDWLQADDLMPLAGSLQRIAETARASRFAKEPSPAIITLANTSQQVRSFRRLRRDEVNRDALSKLQHTLLTLCLDLGSLPLNDAAWAAHSGKPDNRWFHSSLQLVIFGNAKACAIYGFAANLDGNVMMRASAEIQRRAAALTNRIRQGKWAKEGRQTLENLDRFDGRGADKVHQDLVELRKQINAALAKLNANAKGPQAA